MKILKHTAVFSCYAFICLQTNRLTLCLWCLEKTSLPCRLTCVFFSYLRQFPYWRKPTSFYEGTSSRIKAWQSANSEGKGVTDRRQSAAPKSDESDSSGWQNLETGVGTRVHVVAVRHAKTTVLGKRASSLVLETVGQSSFTYQARN